MLERMEVAATHSFQPLGLTVAQPSPAYRPSSPSRKRKRHHTSTPTSFTLGLALDIAKASEPPLVLSRNTLEPPLTTQPHIMASPNRPRFDSAAAAAAAATGQVDGYKPREERSWEEFHPDLDIETEIAIFTADEVDGVPKDGEELKHLSPSNSSFPPITNGSPSRPAPPATPPKRRPGRPPRRPESMLSGLGSPPAPRITPLPAQNPKERLNLPKPSYRRIETFAAYEADDAAQINYVDRAMANVGYQESEMFLRSDSRFVRLMEDAREDDREHGLVLEADGEPVGTSTIPSVTKVEYDMDEQDEEWLEAHNVHRKAEGVEGIKPSIYEITMTQIEKEWYALEKRIPKPNPKPPQTQRPRSSSAAAVNGEPAAAGEEQDSKCAICDDGDCENTNAIVFCDGCDLAVHQECYGVPFIPEGQWLCRKCQFIGRSIPACIFCPNSDGAFKLTQEQRWAHLLCAIWIPEVSLANTTFMEPIVDVVQVPKQRWKLTCYICNQKMGACVQCGNRACYQAFHVTCARRAKLFLKMKASHGAPFTMDASILKAFCDKHVPSEWNREHDVETATREAKSFYRRTMRGRRWADSQQSALALLPSQQINPMENGEDNANREDGQGPQAAAALKRKRLQAQKNVWRLPSGAPIVPQVVFNAVEASLQRFAIRRRKEFAAEACKYWSLKREARRGAALLKRLQLQLESFSSNEPTRRNFAAMGAIGGPRLQRRIDVADKLITDLGNLKKMCDRVKDREYAKLQDAELLKDVVETVYVPIAPLLVPVLRKAINLDSRGVFASGFRSVQAKLETYQYTSVAKFSADLGSVFQAVAGMGSVSDAVEAHNQLAGASLREEHYLTAEQKEVKKLAKRIVKAIQPPLLEAIRKEAELGKVPFGDELAKLDALLGKSLTSDGDRPSDVNGFIAKALLTDEGEAKGDSKVNGIAPSPGKASPASARATNGESHLDQSPSVQRGRNAASTHVQTNNASPTKASADATSPAENDLLAPLTHGGIPWYMRDFSPDGTDVHDERWTGREVLRGMSEELSEIDEDELKELGPQEDSTPVAEDKGTPRSRAVKRRRTGRLR